MIRGQDCKLMDLTDEIANNELEIQQAALTKFYRGISELQVEPDGLLYNVTLSGKNPQIGAASCSGPHSLRISV